MHAACSWLCILAACLSALPAQRIYVEDGTNNLVLSPGVNGDVLLANSSVRAMTSSITRLRKDVQACEDKSQLDAAAISRLTLSLDEARTALDDATTSNQHSMSILRATIQAQRVALGEQQMALESLLSCFQAPGPLVFKTQEGAAWESVTVGGDVYLVIANRASKIWVATTDIFKYNPVSRAFDGIQQLTTQGASSITAFYYESDAYFFVANFRAAEGFKAESGVYQFSNGTFELHQVITTSGASGSVTFYVDGLLFLVVAQQAEVNGQLVLFRWNNESIRFSEVQTIPLDFPQSLECFTLPNAKGGLPDTFVAVANSANSTLSARIFRLMALRTAKLTMGAFLMLLSLIFLLTLLLVPLLQGLIRAQSAWRSFKLSTRLPTAILRSSKSIPFRFCPRQAPVIPASSTSLTLSMENLSSTARLRLKTRALQAASFRLAERISLLARPPIPCLPFSNGTLQGSSFLSSNNSPRQAP
eukprot:m.257306 g.257306  ORF g.257306 m.257306 type:complete len:476 (-) comp54566_c0_seq1:190-1617(-)